MQFSRYIEDIVQSTISFWAFIKPNRLKISFLKRMISSPLGLSGLEPPTSRLSGVRSNRLSYKPKMEMERFELLTPCLQGRCSPN